MDELLKIVQNTDPTDFEKLVLNLLREMGYGGGNDEAVLHQGKAGDGGVDGEINQDASTIGRPAIQQFVGSLNERKSKRGVFITTSSYSKDARDYVDKIGYSISRFIRKTWCTSKKIQSIEDHLEIYTYYHNHFLIK